MKREKLGEIISISKGRKHSITYVKSTYAKRIIGIADLRNDHDVVYTNDKIGTEVTPEDILIAWDGANSGTIGFGKKGLIGSTIARLRFKEEGKYDTNFIGIFLKTQFDYLRKTATGATIPHVSRSALESIYIPNFNKDDQIRISTLLSRVEALIANRKDNLRLLDEFLKSTFLEMFGDSVVGQKGYKFALLDTFITHLTSGGRGWAKYYAETGKRFIRSLDVQMNKIGNEDIVFVRPPKNQETERTRVQENDVLLTITGSKIGRVAYVPGNFEEAYISQHVSIIRTKEINPIYLSYYLSMQNAGQRVIKKMQYGQAKPGLNLTQIREFPILTPPINLQNKFAFIIKRVESLKTLYQQNLSQLNNLYGILSQKAFKGELDLSRIPLPTITADNHITASLPSIRGEAVTGEAMLSSAGKA